MLKKSVMVAVVACVVLCLSAGTLVAGKNCKRVNANVETGEILLAPDCDGYDICQAVFLSGTPNGTMWTYAYWDGFIFWDDGTVINVTVSVIETAHGELFLDDRAIIAPNAPDGAALHSNVTGGTGRYEGATGWLAYYLEWAAGNEGIMRGEICVPED